MLEGAAGLETTYAGGGNRGARVAATNQSRVLVETVPRAYDDDAYDLVTSLRPGQ